MKIQRFERKLPSMDVLEWLSAQSWELGAKIYWSSRDLAFEAACIGVVDRKSNLYEVADLPKGFRYYGGMRFFAGEKEPEEHWKDFPVCDFILPRFELRREGEEVILAYHALGEEADEVQEAMDKLNWTCPSFNGDLPKVKCRINSPDAFLWNEIVPQAIANREKLVLAREVSLNLDAWASPFLLLDKLRTQVPPSFIFCFAPNDQAAFLGLTPELLYHRKEDFFTTEAVAGTRVRGKTSEEDADLEEELLNSKKDLREHGYVSEHLQKTLLRITDSFIVGEYEVLKRTFCQHIYQSHCGMIKDGVNDAQIIEALHPTPALGGYPRIGVEQEIRRLEGIDRGWYGGPVGWISSEEAELAVAIRSALIYKSKAILFSGAGIVKGSVPEDEWKEIEIKIAQFLRVFAYEKQSQSIMGLPDH